jgi:hypothetical protein
MVLYVKYFHIEHDTEIKESKMDVLTLKKYLSNCQSHFIREIHIQKYQWQCL